MDKGTIILIVYLTLGYWATGKTIYRNKILIGTGNSVFMQRLAMAFIMGFILIPVAILITIIESLLSKGGE